MLPPVHNGCRSAPALSAPFQPAPVLTCCSSSPIYSSDRLQRPVSVVLVPLSFLLNQWRSNERAQSRIRGGVSGAVCGGSGFSSAGGRISSSIDSIVRKVAEQKRLAREGRRKSPLSVCFFTYNYSPLFTLNKDIGNTVS